MEIKKWWIRYNWNLYDGNQNEKKNKVAYTLSITVRYYLSEHFVWKYMFTTQMHTIHSNVHLSDRLSCHRMQCNQILMIASHIQCSYVRHAGRQALEWNCINLSKSHRSIAKCMVLHHIYIPNSPHSKAYTHTHTQAPIQLHAFETYSKWNKLHLFCCEFHSFYCAISIIFDHFDYVI